MSLKIASAFISALRSNDELLSILGGQGDKKEGARIFTVARPQEDEGKDKIPYLIDIFTNSSFLINPKTLLR